MSSPWRSPELFTVLAWNNVLPDRRDRLILGLLPVRPRTVLLAKLAALGTALGVAVRGPEPVHGARLSFRRSCRPGAGMTAVVFGFVSYWIAMLAAGFAVCCASWRCRRWRPFF